MEDPISKDEPTEEDAIAGVIGVSMLMAATELLEKHLGDRRENWPHIICDAIVGMLIVGDEKMHRAGEKTMIEQLQIIIEAKSSWARFREGKR